MNNAQIIASQKACFESWNIPENYGNEKVGVLFDLNDVITYEAQKILTDDPDANARVFDMLTHSYDFYRIYLQIGDGLDECI